MSDPRRYVGPAVACSWCAYGVCATGEIRDAKRATHVVETDKGPREVCAHHARRGTWERRARRVSRVA